MSSILSVKGMVKSYGGFKLGPLDFDIPPGVVVGLVGPNGAGKTTAINICAGLVKSESGEVFINSTRVAFDDPKWKFDLGYIGDEPAFYERWTGAKNLKFISQFYPDWSDEKATNLAQRFDLDLNKRAFELSRGNRTKLYLITVLARSPKLLLFDEPTSGLDPVVRSEVLDVLWEIVEQGHQSILYSTHILSDISRIADELMFLMNGKITLRCPKDELVDRWRRISFAYEGDKLSLGGVVEHSQQGNRHIVVTGNHAETESELSRIGATGIEVTRLTVDEVAVQIMKERHHVAAD